MALTSLPAEFIMELHIECPERLEVGTNARGHLRVIQISDGYFKGEKLNGRVVPGGADWNMSHGGPPEEKITARTIFAKYLLQTDDGVYIAIENLGFRHISEKQPMIVTTPSFFAPKGQYDWLNYGTYVASLKGGEVDGIRGVHINVYKML